MSRTMQKNYASVVFDRKNQLATKGLGSVEIYVYLGNGQKKYIGIKKCTESEWRYYQHSVQLANEIAMYNAVAEEMAASGEDMTIYNYVNRLGMDNATREKTERAKLIASSTGFLDFMMAQIEKEKIAPGTRMRKDVTHRALKEWGKMNRFAQVNEANIIAFDEWLRTSAERSTVTIHNYHKILKMYTRAACEHGYIKTDPYDSKRCHFERGKYKERNPLTEDELVKVRSLKGLDPKLERARDMFVFCAYTGLAYIDSQAFDFDTMVEQREGTYFIDGSRIKTGNKFFTPILPPAMEILEKYDFNLPHISNQKLNDYLHLVEKIAKLNKPMTTHVARHSFATLVLSYDIPIENLARMMGHSNIKTTQVYGKILKTTIERHARNLSALIR